MIGLFAGRKRLQQYLDERNQAEEELRNSSNALEAVNKTLNLANQELADHHDHLEGLVHERTLALAEARDQLIEPVLQGRLDEFVKALPVMDRAPAKLLFLLSCLCRWLFRCCFFHSYLCRCFYHWLFSCYFFHSYLCRCFCHWLFSCYFFHSHLFYRLCRHSITLLSPR